LLIGWAAALVLGTWMAASVGFAPVYPLHILGTTVPCYIALASLVVNIVISAVLSLVLNAVHSDRHKDVTVAGDYA
jgi:SSS family solute:Na+ symporter